jgi:hypothetical protein
VRRYLVGGEPLRNLADGKLIVASTDGDGFIVPEAEVVAQTRAGKQVLNLRDGRDWVREAGEELLDAVVYLAAATVGGRDA